MADLIVDWARDLTSVGWRVDAGARSRKIPISWFLYLQAPSHLRKRGAVSRFQKIANAKHFRDWWLQECGGGDRTLKRFFLRFPPRVWDIPWELLVGELDGERQSSVSIVRGLRDQPSTLPSCFDRPMSVLIIRGDDGARTNLARLNLDRECDLLLDAYDRLPAAHREAMLKPRIVQPINADFPALFRDAATVPDVIFLSGHGSSDPPSFMLSDGSSLRPEQFAKAISATAVRPMFAAFWACDTARGPGGSREVPSPPFYAALLQAGVASFLAMQAPVSDDGAILLAQEVLQALAGGHPLDAAAARARAVLREAHRLGARVVDWLDWACPVVWSSGLPAARLAWRGPGSPLAQMQMAARRARFDREGRVFFPPTDAEIACARRIAASRLWWINAQDLAEHRECWIRLLFAIQVVLPRYIVAVELREEDPADGLRMWAEELQQTLEPGGAGSDFRSTLELIRYRPKEGWARLCLLPDLAISIWMPPRYVAGDWFWAPLMAATTPVVVLGGVDDEATVSGWSVEGLDMATTEDVLIVAHTEAPQLSDALALLDMPVPKASIDAASPIDAAPRLKELTITTTANELVIAASAARFFRDRMDDEARRRAHRTCMTILAHPSFAGRLTPAIRERRLTHCLGAAETDAAIEEASALLVKYRELDRPRAALGVAQRLGALWRELPENLLIIRAWTHVMLDEIEEAAFWLDRSTASNALELAWQHGLRAEINKARGDREAARAEVDAAITTLKAVPAEQRTEFIERRLRAYRQDHARIRQYLFYEPAAAAEEYKALLAEWLGGDDTAIDVAVVLRNYSECVRTGHRPGDTEWQQSRDMLQQATDLLRNNHDHPVYAELEYEKARVKIAEGASDEAKAKLLVASEAAAACGHLMLQAIVKARMFWEFEAFDLARWTELDAALSAFPHHGWAARTLIDGRLRAAKRVGNPQRARQLLEANLRTLQDNPSFSAGSDRFRIAASFAGHDLLAGDVPPRWPDFLNLSWAPEWLASKGLHDPPDVWGRIA